MKAKIPDFTHSYLLDTLHYEPLTGNFIRLKKANRNHIIGTLMGNIGLDGRCRITFAGARVLRSRLAWFYMTGRWPIAEVDHIDRDRGNDRWVNLREATRSQNLANTCLRSNNTSGYRGVTWLKREKKWLASLRKEGRFYYRGYFDDPEDASKALNTAAQEAFHGYWRPI